MEENIYITKEVIANVEHSELEFILYSDFGFDYDTHSEFVELLKGNPDVTNEPIKIDRLIESLQELKEKGSTHVALDYHTDHIGYEMTGYKIYHSTEEQIKTHVDKQKTKHEKDLKIEALRNEMRRIENE
jgi:hypothetical protein